MLCNEPCALSNGSRYEATNSTNAATKKVAAFVLYVFIQLLLTLRAGSD